jgi:hypothetical protein
MYLAKSVLDVNPEVLEPSHATRAREAAKKDKENFSTSRYSCTPVGSLLGPRLREGILARHSSTWEMAKYDPPVPR